MKKNLLLSLIPFLFIACQNLPSKPLHLGDTETQETTHLFSNDYETVFNAAKKAYSELGLAVKKSDLFGNYLTATRNSGKGFTSSTMYFYPVSNGVRVRIVTKSNSAEKPLAEVNEQVIAYTTKKLIGS